MIFFQIIMNYKFYDFFFEICLFSFCKITNFKNVLKNKMFQLIGLPKHSFMRTRLLYTMNPV